MIDLPVLDQHTPRGRVRPSRRSVVRAIVLVGVHVAALVHLAHWRIAGTTLTPLEPSEAKQTLELGYVNAGFVLLLVSIGATLIVGRFFCGWACHVVAYQDASAWLLGKLGLRPRPVRSRLLMAVPFLAAFDMFFLPTVLRLARGDEAPTFALHMFTGDLWETFPGPMVGLLTLFVDGCLLVWFLGAKGFCTNACPYGALFGVAERAAKGRIRVTDACEGCGHCTSVCTSNVRVHEEVARFGHVVDSGCMRCMDCVSVCPKEALYFGFQPVGAVAERANRAGPRRPVRRWDFSWREELALGALAVTGVFAFRGLYGRVPLMLALGLGVLVALGTLTLVRLVRVRDFRLQWLSLRTDGRLTRAGTMTLVALVIFLLASAHSLVVQGTTRWGTWLVNSAFQSPAPDRDELVERGRAALLYAETIGWLDDATIQNQLGQLDLNAGRYEAAAGRLRRAVSIAPRMRSARLGLADAALRLDEVGEAEENLIAILERAPHDSAASWKLAQISIMRRDFEAARPLLEAAASAAPNHAGIRRDLERVQAALGR